MGLRSGAWLCGLLVCCSSDPPRATPAPPPAPSAAVRALELPALERARLDYLFAAAELVARDWPQLVAAEVCVLLIAQSAQWVANCSEAPAGFARLTSSYRGRPIFAHAGSAFATGGAQRSARELLASLPAAAHVFPKGRAKADLPPRHPWLLLGTLEALREFHPAFGPAATEHWLSVAMHELVHIHQLRQPDFAADLARIDDQSSNPAALTARYARDREFRRQVEREYTQLVAAAEATPDPAAAKGALQTWLRSYRMRSARFDPASSRDERLFTYLEGVARFVESDFLVNAAQHPAVALTDPKFHAFERFTGRGYGASPNRQLDEQYYYAIGYHLCVLLERVDPTWKQRVHSEPGWLIGVIERL